MTSSLAVRVRLSLADVLVRRLVVCLSCDDHQSSEARGALGGRVAQQIIDTCAPAPSDVHCPDKTRLHARDAFGQPRRNFGSYRRGHFFKCVAGNGSGRVFGKIRGPQTWDSERVVDYMGVWCDRLLLGEHTNPLRCALLEPRVPCVMLGESLERVLLAHRSLRSRDILFVFASPTLPFGVTRLVAFDDALLFPLSSSFSAYGHESLGALVQRLAGNPDAASALVVGVGDACGPLFPLTAEEKLLVTSRIVPLASFCCALWSVNPTKAEEYLQSDPKDNARLWRTMQSSLLSTRDTAVLRAYKTGQPLDARMSQRQTTYLAETLLSRLFPQDFEC